MHERVGMPVQMITLSKLFPAWKDVDVVTERVWKIVDRRDSNKYESGLIVADMNGDMWLIFHMSRINC